MSEQERILSQNNPPVRKDREIALEEMRLKTLSQFLSSPRQKTQIKPSERIILSLLYKLAEKPFETSIKIAKSRGIIISEDRFKDKFFLETLDNYLEFGIPIDREGRKEDERALTGYFSSLMPERQAAKTPTLMK